MTDYDLQRLRDVIKSLQNATDVTYNIDPKDKNVDRSYPFACGYSRAAMEGAIFDLKYILGNNE